MNLDRGDWLLYPLLFWSSCFTSEVVRPLIKQTVLDPALTLIDTKKGLDLAVLHETAFSRIQKLFYFGLVRWVSGYLDRGVLDNWTSGNFKWNQEIVLLTGGAGGIVGGVVKLLSGKGIKVVVIDVIPMTFETASNIHYYKCDITCPAAIASVAAQIRKDVGEPTILINNAGVCRGKMILEASEKDIRFTFEVNILAHYWMAREFVPDMAKENHGMIVTVSSFAAFLSVPDMVDYDASKAAAHAFHEGLAVELKCRYNAPKVRTVVVNQGYTKTALFEGYKNDSNGQLIIPGFSSTLTLLRGMPHWYQNTICALGKDLMSTSKGRQVIDVEKWKPSNERKDGELSE
ncbi:putative short-chain dehydrogenase/reductase family 16C member 6 [Amylocarpus encephaloides]|uniref:Short-chain dehydrogenase/reductase family 16C member 6 n=1 Tax=Amylocarpus encephaloides TaxID=45428 RepID=A0A9P7YCW4_9HELO|nr:putative short-chain dehydrogenase/reductase family 16C member 6 [Amylocarpus encephaloides]